MVSADVDLLKDYLAAGTNLVARTETSGSLVLPRLSRELVDMGTLLILSDRSFRSAERREALGLCGPEALVARERAMKYNRIALAALSTKLPALTRELRAELKHAKTPDLTLFRETLQDQLLGLDLKGKSAAFMNKRLTHCFERAKKAGVKGACKFMEEQLDELKELRLRRPKQNDPVSAAVGGAFAIAGIIYMISCSQAGTCGQPGNVALAMILFGVAAAFIVAAIAVAAE